MANAEGWAALSHDDLSHGPAQNIAYWLNQIGFVPTTSNVRVFNVTNYGALVDGVMVKSDIIDVAGILVGSGADMVTAGSRVVTSASANFVGPGTTPYFGSIALGMGLRVHGASTGDVCSFITKVNSATSVNLNNSVTTTPTTGNSYTYGTGASLVSGGTLLNDPCNSVFTGQHNGYVIRIKGAGAAGADLVTTVASTKVSGSQDFSNTGQTTQSAGQITLATAASTSVSCASYTLGPGSLTGVFSGGALRTLVDTANGNFIPEDVGKQIRVFNAGAASADVTTTITSFTNSTTVHIGLPVNGAGTYGYVYSNGGSMTSGSAVLTDSNHTFSAADVGKVITVRNAMATRSWGQPGPSLVTNMNTLCTTVASFNPALPNQITLAAGATANVFAATYMFGHDDTTAINNAMLAAQAVGGGAVVLGNGVSMVTGALGVDGSASGASRAPLALFGSGMRASSIALGAELIGTLIQFTDLDNLELAEFNVEGNLLCNGICHVSTDGHFVRNVHIRDCRFTEGSPSNNAAWSIELNGNGSYNLIEATLENCVIENIPTSVQDLVGLESVEAPRLINCTIVNSNQSVSFFGTTDGLMSGCTLRNIRARGVGCVLMNGFGTSLEGNKFFTSDWIQPYGAAQSINMVGNQLYDTSLQFSSNQQMKHINVVGNTFTFDAGANGFILLGCTNGLIFANNTIDLQGDATNGVVQIQSATQSGGSALADVLFMGNILNGCLMTGTHPVLRCSMDAYAVPTIASGSTVVSITAGTPTLTAAAAIFQAGDVGKPIEVYGAGKNGNSMLTTISTFNSSTSVTLNNNANTTVSGVIAVYGRAGGCIISHNIFDTPGPGGDGIHMSGAADCSVHDNKFLNFQSTWSIIEDTSSARNVYYDNDLGASSLGISLIQSAGATQSDTNHPITLNGNTTVTVSTTAGSATSEIRLTRQTFSGAAGVPFVVARTVGTSFGVQSTGASDLGKVTWRIVEQG